MAFAAPTYGASYDQTEQNANAVLIAAGINTGGTNDGELRAALLAYIAVVQTALTAIQNRNNGDSYNTAVRTAISATSGPAATLIAEVTP